MGSNGIFPAVSYIHVLSTCLLSRPAPPTYVEQLFQATGLLLGAGDQGFR